MKSANLGLRISPDAKNRAEEIAALENITLSEWVELWIKRGIADFDRKKP